MTRARGRGLAAIGFICLLPACASLAPRPTAADVARAPARTPALTLTDLEQGRTIYLRRCASCHQPFDPASQRADSWPHYVDKMKQRARLSDSDANRVVDYLVTMARS